MSKTATSACLCLLSLAASACSQEPYLLDPETSAELDGALPDGDPAARA